MILHYLRIGFIGSGYPVLHVYSKCCHRSLVVYSEYMIIWKWSVLVKLVWVRESCICRSIGQGAWNHIFCWTNVCLSKIQDWSDSSLEQLQKNQQIPGGCPFEGQNTDLGTCGIISAAKHSSAPFVGVSSAWNDKFGLSVGDSGKACGPSKSARKGRV